MACTRPGTGLHADVGSGTQTPVAVTFTDQPPESDALARALGQVQGSNFEVLRLDGPARRLKSVEVG